MFFGLFLIQVFGERTKTCTRKQTLFDLTNDNYDQVIGQSRPVFVRIENEGCPYSKPSQYYWEEASNLFPNIKFVRAECIYNGEVCKKLGAEVSPTHILFGANSTDKLQVYTSSTPISISSTPYADIIFSNLGFYPFDTPSIQEIIPESSNLFFETYKYPIFILYDSSCDEDSDFIAQFLIEATENYISSDDYGFGKIDCSKYPEECSKWGATYPSANIFSRQKAISASITEIDRIGDRIELAVKFLEQSNQVYPTPVPYVPPTSQPLPTITNVRTISVPELENRDISTIKGEYDDAKKSSYEGKDYNEETADAYSCSSVTLKKEAYADVLKLLNFYRKLAGLSSDVKNDEQLNEGCQLAAKYSSRSASLSHSINDYWKETCDFNSGGNWELISSSLKNSNLAQGPQRVIDMISGLMDDEGVDNEGSVGHRRWFLYPYLTKIGIGFYPLSLHQFEGYKVQYPPSGVFNVINDVYNTNEYTAINFISWPPAGPFPLERLPSSWSIYYKEFQKNGVSIDDVVIKLTRDDGINLECSSSNLATNAFGLKGTLVFKLNDNSLKLIKAGRSVHVQVYFLKDSIRDCLDYTIDFFDDKVEDSICFYNTDKSKCPSNIDDAKKFGNSQYSNYHPDSFTRVIIHVVEDIKLTSDLKLDFAPFIIIKGKKIEGKIIIAPNIDLDIQEPISTDFIIQIDSAFNCGVLKTPGKSKSIEIELLVNPTIKSRSRKLVYFGSYVNIKSPKKIRSGDYDYIFGVAFNGQEAYFVCTPVLYVQYACEGGNRGEYNLDSTLNCYEFSASYSLNTLKTNKKYFKVYAASSDFKISSSTLFDSDFSDYEFYVDNSVNLEYSSSLEFIAKSIKISSYKNRPITASFTYPTLDLKLNGLADIHSKLQIYPFTNLYISNLNSNTNLNGYSVPGILGDESAKTKLQRQEPVVYDESSNEFTDENGCYNYHYESRTLTPLFITNGNHNQYNFTYTDTSGNNNILRLKPTEGSASNPTVLIFNPKHTNGNWENIFIENYQDLTIKTAIPSQYGSSYDYFARIRLQNVSRVRFVSLDGQPITGIQTDITGSSDVDFSSTEDNQITFQRLIVRSSPTITAKNTQCNELNVVSSSPKIQNMIITTFNVYDYSNVKLKNSSVSGAVEARISDSKCPTIKVINSQFNPSSFQVFTQKFVDNPDEYNVKLLSSDNEPQLLFYGLESDAIEELKSKVSVKTRIYDNFNSYAPPKEIANKEYKVILSKDKRGIYLVKNDFDESNAPESVPEDEEDKELDNNFEVLPSPPPPPPEDPTKTPEEEPSSNDNNEDKSSTDITPDLPVISQDLTPDLTPTAALVSEVVVNININKDANSKELDELLKQEFSNNNEDENDQITKVGYIDVDKINFNSELSTNQFIKTKENAEINFEGGNLNLVFPDQGKVTVICSQENPNISFKGNGNVELIPSSNTRKLIEIKTNSQINGTVKITVPDTVDDLLIESISLESESAIEAQRTNNDSVNLTIKNVDAKQNSNSQISNLAIENSLTIAQTAVVKIKNIALNTAKITFEVEDFSSWNKSSILGTFSNLPVQFIINGNGNSPSFDVDYSLLEGTFEATTCNEWLERVEMRNTGLTSKRCDDLLIIQDSENKRIVVSAVKEESNKLNAGQIAGIVIGCVAAVAIIAVVIIFVIRKKKTTQSQSEFSGEYNSEDEVGL